MKIAVIYGSDKHDIMCNHVNLLLTNLKAKTNIYVNEFFISSELPIHDSYSQYSFLCDIEKNSEYSKAANNIINYLNNANLIIVASSSYSHKANIPLKYFLQYLSYKWMPHRPNTLMQSKMGVVIGSCLHGNFNIASSIAKQLHCWGIQKDSIFSKSFNFNDDSTSYFQHLHSSSLYIFTLAAKILEQYKNTSNVITLNLSANNYSNSNTNSSAGSVYNINLNPKYNANLSTIYKLNSISNNNHDSDYNSNNISVKKRVQKTLSCISNLKKVVHGYIY